LSFGVTIDPEAARKIINDGKAKGLIAVKRPTSKAESPHPAMQVKCPTCGATEGALCKPVFGWVGRERVHYSRMTLFENQNACSNSARASETA